MTSSDTTKAVVFEFDDGSTMEQNLTEEQVCDLTSAAMYGCGWFRYRKNGNTHMVNMNHVHIVTVMADE